MRLKTFTGATVREAMSAVRREIGRDAVILSTRTDPLNGQCSIVAALDDRPPPAPAPETATVPESQSEAGDAALRDVLAHHRIPERIARRLERLASESAGESPEDRLAVSLDILFGFATLPLSAERPLMLVGPPGAGKTTTAAKLAARAALQGAPVRLVTTDTVRSGAYAQLKDLARLIAAPCGQAATPEELARHLADDGERPLIVDTAGASPFDVDDLHRLRQLAKAVNARLALVLPAGLDPDDCADTARAFAAIGGRMLLVTRLDTTRRYGGLIAAAEAADLDLTEVSAAASLTDALRPLNPCSLARLLAGQADSSVLKQRAAP